MTAEVIRQADAQPVAYVRRSVVSRNAPGDTSRDVQTQAVRDLAGDEAGRLRIIDGDWGRAASRGELEDRTAFHDMLTSIKAGEVSAVYAYATDRLARDVEASAHLLNQCERAGVTIYVRGAVYPPGDQAARTAFHLSALMNEDYSDRAKQRQIDNQASRKRREDAMGPPPYGYRVSDHAQGERVKFERDPERDPAVLLAAYREAGSINGAVRLLNERNVPGPRGRWWSGPLGRVLAREYPDEFDVRTVEPRVRSLEPANAKHVPIFRRVLRCHCGSHMTGVQDRNGAYPAYRCSTGLGEPRTGTIGRRSISAGHPHGISVRAHVIREWAEVEAAKFDQLVIEIEARGGPALDPAELQARIDRAGEAFAMGALNRERTTEIVAEARRLLASIVDQTEAWKFLRNRRGVRWSEPPAVIASDIRRLWSAVHLDEHMRPTRADWRVAPPAGEMPM